MKEDTDNIAHNVGSLSNTAAHANAANDAATSIILLKYFVYFFIIISLKGYTKSLEIFSLG